jgi:hypothetical protein
MNGCTDIIKPAVPLQPNMLNAIPMRFIKNIPRIIDNYQGRARAYSYAIAILLDLQTEMLQNQGRGRCPCDLCSILI